MARLPSELKALIASYWPLNQALQLVIDHTVKYMSRRQFNNINEALTRHGLANNLLHWRSKEPDKGDLEKWNFSLTKTVIVDADLIVCLIPLTINKNLDRTAMSLSILNLVADVNQLLIERGANQMISITRRNKNNKCTLGLWVTVLKPRVVTGSLVCE